MLPSERKLKNLRTACERTESGWRRWRPFSCRVEGAAKEEVNGDVSREGYNKRL